MAKINEFAQLLAEEAAKRTAQAATAAKAAAAAKAGAAAAAPATAQRGKTASSSTGVQRMSQAAKNSAQKAAAAAAEVKGAPAAYYSPAQFGADMQNRESAVTRSRLQMDLAAPELGMRHKLMEDAYAAATQKRERYYKLRGQFRGENAAALEQQVLDEWTAATKAYQDAAAAYQQAYGKYKPYEDAYRTSVDDYNRYLESEREAYQTWRGTIRSEDAIRAEQESYKNAEQELEGLMKLSNEWSRLPRSAGTDAAIARNQARIAQLQEYLGSDGEKGRLLQEELEWSQYYKYDDLRGEADFDALSRYQSTADGGQTRIDPLGGAVYGSQFSDPVYDYINRNGAAVAEQTHNNRLNDLSYLEFMTDDEIAMYNYVYAEQGREAAQEYLNTIRTTLTARQMGQTEGMLADMATSGPLGGLTASAISVGLSPISGFQSTLGQAASVLTGREIDPNASYNLATNAKNAMRQAVRGKIEENFGPVGSFAYNTGMSILDVMMDRHVASGLTGGQGVLRGPDGTETVVNLAQDRGLIKAAVEGGAKLHAYASPAVMTIVGSRAFSEYVIDGKNRGLNDNQALTLGLTAALAELVTERIGLDELGKLPNEDAARSLLGRIWKGGVGEAAEEGMTSIINFAADQIISGEQSEFWQNVKEFQDEGFSEQDAFLKAMSIAANGLGMDIAGGFVSGGVFGAADRSGKQSKKQKTDISPTNDSAAEMTEKLGTERLTLEQAKKQAIDRLNPLTTGVAHTVESRAKLERIEQADTVAEVTGAMLGVDEERIQSAIRLSKLLGKDIRFYSADAKGQDIEYGQYLKNADQIAVNAQSPQVIAVTIGHELTHSVEDAASYERLRGLVMGRMSGTELDGRRQEIRALYSKSGVQLSDEDLDREVVAKYVEQHLLTDEDHIRQLVSDDRSVAQRIFDWLDKLWAKLSKSEAVQEREFVRQARAIYRAALEESGGRKQRRGVYDAAVQAYAEGDDAAGDAAIDRLYDSPGAPDLLAPLDDDGVSYSFGGVQARGADLAQLEEAKRLAEADVDAAAIFRKTGWYQGADGKWRFEIDDSKMRYDKTGNLRGAENVARARETAASAKRTLEAAADRRTLEKVRAYDAAMITNNETRRGALYAELAAGEYGRQFREYADARELAWANRFASGGSVGDYIDHEALFAQYPQLRDMPLRFADLSGEDYGGFYSDGEITLDESLRDAPEDALIHEIQHAIQEAEGFASGATTEYWQKIQDGENAVMRSGTAVQRALDRAEQVLAAVPEDAAAQFRQAIEMRQTDPEGARELAERLAQSEHAAEFVEFCEAMWLAEERRNPFELYWNTAGEIEARDAARRQWMNPDERKKRLPDTGDGETVFVEDGAGRSYSIGPDMTDEERYEELKDRVISVIRDDHSDDYAGDIGAIEVLPGRAKSKVEKIIKPLAVKLGILNRTMHTPEVEIDFQFSANKGLSESLHKQLRYGGSYGDFAKALIHLDEILENAVLIERHGDKYRGTVREDENLKGVYVLLGALDTENGVVPVQMEIKESADAGSKLYMTVAMTKIEAGVVGSTPGVTQARSLLPASIYRIADIFAEINPNDAHFLKYVPDGFLDNAQLEAKRGALDEDARRISSYEKKRYSIGAVATKAEDGVEPEELTGKVRQHYDGARRKMAAAVAKALDVPYHAKREFLEPIVERMAGEYLRSGTISQETRDELFETAWEQGRAADTEFYDTYKDVKDFLRTTAVTISEGDRWPDFQEFRRQAFGTLRIKDEGGTPVDTLWEELREMALALFPENILNPEDQLRHMLDVGRSIRKSEQHLDTYYGEDAAEMKYYSHVDFEAAVQGAISELWKVRRVAAEQKAEAAAVAAPEGADGEGLHEMTVEEVMALYPKLKDARKAAEKAMAKNLLSKSDKEKVQRLLRHDIQPEHLDPKTDNVAGIMAVYEAKWLYEQAAEPIRKWNQVHKAGHYAQAEELLSGAGTIEDKKAGWRYSRETMERNIRDIVKNPEAAEAIIKTYFTPVHEAAAKVNRMKNEFRDRVRKLKLSRKAKKGDQVSESYAVQFYGEVSDILKVMEDAENATKKPNPERLAKRVRDGKSYEQWRAELNELWKNNPGLDRGKIEAAAAEFAKIYEELFGMMNEARVANGYEPINHRSGYFPHFQADGRDGILAQFGKALGIDVEVQPLPTTINGLTHTFKPGIRWFGNALERKGFQTAYDAVEGFDRYIEGVADVVHQTENIQRLRALANQMRYRTGDEGLREQIRKIQARTDLNDEEKDAMVKAKWENGRFELSNFVVELDEYTNLLANKKSRADRNMEQALGRKAYNVVKAMESRVAANMVAINPGSWLTNFIPLTQGWACLDTKRLLGGMWQTLKAVKADDGIADRSSFLTNRQGSERLIRTWDVKASSVLGKPMEWIDGFTSGSLVRARYQQNLSRGMSEAEAMSEADEWTAGVMADRSKGAMPTVFSRSNPFTKLFTQFQLEVNNQYSYLLKDIPRQKRDKVIKSLVWALMKFAIGAWLYNEAYEHFLGRRPALDPIDLLVGTVENLMDEETTVYEDVAGLAGDALEQTPFIGGLLGGGRVPISSALPDWENLGKAVFNNEWSMDKRVQTGAKELLKPVAYILPPFGGGQLKKIWEGLQMMRDGGSYTLDAEGNPQLQYPLYSTNAAIQQALEAGQAMIFGKTTLKSGRKWIEGGFGSLSAEQTAAYRALLEMGVSQKEAYELLTELREAEKTDEESRAQVQRRVLDLWGLDGEATALVYYDLLASDKEAALMDTLRADGADMGKVARTIMNIKDADAMYDGAEGSIAMREAILYSGLNGADTATMYYEMLATEKEQALMDALRTGGADMGKVARTIMNIKDADAMYSGATGSNAKRDAIMDSGLSDGQKQSVYRSMISESWDEEIQAFKDVGLDMDEFLTAQNAYSSIKEQYEDEGDMATAFSRWVNQQDYTQTQGAVIRDSLKYWQMMPAEAERYDRAISEGLSDAEAYKMAEGIKALGKDPDDVEKWRVAIDQSPELEDQLQRLRAAGLSGTTYDKVEAGWELGLPPAAWVRAKEVTSQYDANGNGNLTQAEIKALIDGISTYSVVPEEGKYHLTTQQKAVLWQMLVDKSTKSKNNPYSPAAGQQWREAMGYE